MIDLSTLPPPPFLLQDNDGDEDEKYLKALVYGAHGVGKTYLSGTAADVPEMRDVLMLSVEGGDMTLKNNPEREFKNITKVQARSFAQIAAFQKFVIAHCAIRDNDDEVSNDKLIRNESWLRGRVVSKPRRFYTVIIDSLAEVDSVHRNLLQGIIQDTDLEQDPEESSWATYNKNLSKITRFVKQIRDLPINAIFTAPSAFLEDATKRKRWRPKMVGQLATDVQGVVDVVGFLEAGNVNPESGEIPRRLWVMPTSSHDAKCRGSYNKEAYFMDPDMETIMRKVGLIQR